MNARLVPERGDVVVREDVHVGRRVYVLYTVPGADQFHVRTREEAIAQAAAFAKRERVRAWLTDERPDATFELLYDFKVVEPV
jgi:hypothetical protein